jgi:hypothetical protein
MNNRSRTGAGVIEGICLFLGFASAAYAQTQSPAAGAARKAIVTNRAMGTFEVKLNPLPLDDKDADATLARMSIDKQYHGDLEAAGKGEMLTAGTTVKGSAGYVAIERVSGTLHGRSGAFVLQHSGTMTRGTPQLNVSVVPDSGTGQLAGLTGKMTIQIAGGKHSYEFAYTLPDVP